MIKQSRDIIIRPSEYTRVNRRPCLWASILDSREKIYRKVNRCGASSSEGCRYVCEEICDHKDPILYPGFKPDGSVHDTCDHGDYHYYNEVWRSADAAAAATESESEESESSSRAASRASPSNDAAGADDADADDASSSFVEASRDGRAASARPTGGAGLL